MNLNRVIIYFSGALLIFMSLFTIRLYTPTMDTKVIVVFTLGALGVLVGFYLMISPVWMQTKTSSSPLCVEYESREDMLIEDLVRAMRFTDGESYERAVTTVVLRMACRQNGEQPGSADELLERFDLHTLAKEDNVKILKYFTPREVEKVHVRCLALSQLDQIIGR